MFYTDEVKNRDPRLQQTVLCPNYIHASFCDRVVILRDGVVWRTLEKGATDRTAFQDQLLDAIRDMGKE